jgi:serine/threonine-protein kinase HipA
VSTRAAAHADVYKGPTHVGELERDLHGASFRYVAAYAASHLGQRGAAVAFALPVRAEPYPIVGTNLHPFFAGLLPEGLRLRALIRSQKTSADDLFTLLLAAGTDTIGDVSVTMPSLRPEERAPIADTSKLSEQTFESLLEQSLRYGDEPADVSIAGVQPKVSAARISLPIRAKDQRRAYILKLSQAEYPKLVENEAFFMALAKTAGLDVARTRIVHDRSGASALLVERFDRVPDAAGVLRKLPQEDACQLLERYPADKYRLTLADLSAALEVCSAPLVERLKLLRLQAFSYLIGNGDLHGKNLSVQRLDQAAAHVALTPSYDILSTLPYGDQHMALSMEGRDSKLTRTHFIAFGERTGLRRSAVEQMLDSVCKRIAPALPRLPEIGLAKKPTAQLERSLRARLELLAASA